MKKKTALYHCHLSLGARMIEFASVLLPLRFSSERQEHLAVRGSAGIFDVSHMGEIFIEGNDAQTFLQHLLSNDIDSLIDGQGQYTLMLDSTGGIIDDLIIYRFDHRSFMACVNAANIATVLNHMLERAKNFDAIITDRSDHFCQIAIQGPRSEAIVKELYQEELPKKFFLNCATWQNIDIIISRTGYTGEDGFEIFLANEHALKLWSALLSFEHRGLIPCGLAARDSLRIEAGLLLHGQDIDETTTPIEARLMFAVKLSKDDFFGKEALVAKKSAEQQKILCGFRLTKRGIARRGFGVYDVDGQHIGVVTSSCLPPEQDHCIGFAYINKGRALSASVTIDIRGKMVEAQLTGLRFSSEHS